MGRETAELLEVIAADAAAADVVGIGVFFGFGVGDGFE